MAKRFRVGSIQPKMQVFNRSINPFEKDFSISAVDRYYEKNVETVTSLLEEAGKSGVQVVSTQEDITGAGPFVNFSDHPELFDRGCDVIPGRLSDRIGRIAKKYNMYVIACYYERADDHIFNTALLIGPNGETSGKYRKVQLAAQETFRVDPGDDIPVFPTEFGNVGVLICYDLWFPEICRILGLKGADLVFNPTEGFAWAEDIGLCKVRTRAEENHVHLVVARKFKAWNKPGRSCVVNPYGTIVADAGYAADAFVSAEIQLGPKSQPDVHHVTLFTGITDMREYSLKERRPEVYSYLINPKPDLLNRYSPRKIDTRSKPAELVEKQRLLHTQHIDFMETGDLPE